MSEQASVLAPKQEPSDGGAVKPSGAGMLPSHAIRELVRSSDPRCGGHSLDQIQPASIDLRLGATAYRTVRVLPGGKATVKTGFVNSGMQSTSRTGPSEVGCVYRAFARVFGSAAARGARQSESSTGRIDVLTRLIWTRRSIL